MRSVVARISSLALLSLVLTFGGTGGAQAAHRAGPPPPAAPTQAAATTAIVLQNGWTGAPFGTAAPSAVNVSGVVHLKGAMSTSGTNPVAFTLPSALRPPATVYLRIDLCNANTGRLVIQSNGVATVTATTTFSEAQCFTSLDGASFLVSAGTPLTLQNDWFGGPYGTSQPASGTVWSVVHLKGSIQTQGSTGVPFTLPSSQRPSAAVYVPVDMCNATIGRLMIRSDGTVTPQWISNQRDAQCFTSLDGASFLVSAGTPLTLQNGWTGGPFGTRQPAASGAWGVVRLQGAISTSGSNSSAFTLPAGMRPKVAVFVPVDLCNANPGRLYIQPSGAVTVQANGSFSNAQCFTSLDGASFVL
ncbi:MAG: hypothetical protein JWN46_1734 [Acidimicrobiales bacterium]|nr:hypothetical protein [Acidimicrobiales bacterium]